MAELLINQFSGGWMPCDNPISGRKNGMLQMDNLELDSNGALSLQGGCTVKNGGYLANHHTLFSRLINGARHDYALLANGSGYRDGVSLFASGGDTKNGAFGTAFNYTLICSGDKRYKDSGSGTPVALGLTPPTSAPTLTVPATSYPKAQIATVNTFVDVVGTHVLSGTNLLATCDTNGEFTAQNYNDGGPYNTNALVGSGTGNTGWATDDDYFDIIVYSSDPLLNCALRIDILLVAGNVSGAQVSDYFSYTITDLAQLEPWGVSGFNTLRLRRSQFLRIGSGSPTWATVYGIRFTLTGCASGQLVQLGFIDGTPTYFYGGSKVQNGQYQYLSIFVNNTGSYIAKSIASPISNQVTVDMGQIRVTPYTSGYDVQCNELWVYRRGGLLDAWYRIVVQTLAVGWGQFYDTMSDQDALTLNSKLNINLISLLSTSLTDKIYEIIGPVNGRWYYFTENFMYPSDINNPDSVDPSIAIRTCGSSSELFMWARQIDDSTILVGTSVDVYTLSGTFATFPDFSIDAYYRPLHCKYPPITCDAASWNGIVYYLANDGWRSIAASGANPSLVSPSLDRLYRGEFCTGYQPPNLKVTPRSTRFPVVIAKNKLWCFITGIPFPRIEIYDFIRQYWRTSNYYLGDVSAATSTQDGQILAAYINDKALREIDIQNSKLIDGTTKQAITLKSMVLDNGQPRNRKDSATIKVRLQASDTSIVAIYPDAGSSAFTVGSTVASQVPTDNPFDLSTIPGLALVKSYQITIGGFFSEFILNDASILYDPRPEQRSFMRILNTNFGSAVKKRLRVWPFVVDSLSNDVIFTPSVDNVAQPAIRYNNNHKDTLFYQFLTDVNGVDYGGILQSPRGLFEFYEMLPPEIVQSYPIAKQFDQIGPEELFRYGKIEKIEFVLLPEGGTSLPFTIFFNDTNKYNGTITMIDRKQGSYFMTVPKGTSGSILRIELGPTLFPFHRFYTRLLVTRSGRDTELEWINL